jgi:phosphoribosyl-ATP pyrophosphohydrolase
VDLDAFHDAATPAINMIDDGLLSFWVNGLTGEVGEVIEAFEMCIGLAKANASLANISKKMDRAVLAGHALDDADDALLKEAGDVLFYLRQVLERRGLTLNDAAVACLRKLAEIREAQPNG